MYLGQSVYSSTLVKRTQSDGSAVWFDANGTGMDDSVHCLAPYAVKYWARHLEYGSVEDDIPIRQRVEAFVASSNFQTLLQIQTLWVEGQFSVYAVEGRPSVLRVLPAWLIRVPNRRRFTATKPWLDYNILHHNWSRLLDCDGCHYADHDCTVRPYRGDIDRIWWGSLGPEHMFSGFRARYPSFRLVQPLAGVPLASGNRYEAISVNDAVVHILRFSSTSQDGVVITFGCERWKINSRDSQPSLLTQQVLSTTEPASHWSLYTKCVEDMAGTLCASPTAFSDDGRLLRIGAQLFYQDSTCNYQPLPSSSIRDATFPSYVDDMTRCGEVVAIGSRSLSAADRVLAEAANIATMDLDLTRLESWASTKYRPVDVEVDNTADWETSSSSSAHTDGAAVESWSEGSTDDAFDMFSSSDSSDPLEGDQSIFGESSSETSSDVGPTAEEVSDDSEPPTPLHATSFPQFRDLDSDDEELFWANEMRAQLRLPPRISRLKGPSFGTRSSPESSDDEGLAAANGPPGEDYTHGEEAEMSLTVLRLGADTNATSVFHFRHRLTIMLYDSPPAVHPRAPLVVWPLGAGEILFVDYVAKSYFIRKLRSSAPLTRHLSVKVHFPSCGKLLHIASLEAQICKLVRRRYDRSGKVVKETIDALRLYVFVSTYRLSARKTTRSPPSIIHHCKAFLGTCLAINPLQLPCTFTWTQNALFVTLRDSDFTVYSIPLLRAADKTRGVLVPTEKVFLPDNAPHRAVFFSPGASDDSPAFIVLGSEPREPTNDDALFATATHRGVLAPPICCLLDQDRDLGNWVPANGVRMPMPHGVGKLDQRREKFDPQDDCDVAPYIRFV
ncbi:hypothetical protein EXIGLDRAFT_729613 [Exidia glandulosa HHB12029]|uniref:Uncharacterized protein n=1 Tax=Exidia glandulosa HHB12029 TaxID=1314781 RepID=A0A165LGM9_EXIGL|nr:hypothetical protein EXIGLDRAFT_729613 [Exidia glandulosa HHB12029]